MENETRDSVNRHINDAPDSLEIGTPAKGGAVKIYGNYNDVDAFKAKIDAAKQVREYAQEALAAVTGS